MPTILRHPTQAPSAKQVPLGGAFQTPNPPDFFGVAPINPTVKAQGVADLGRGVSNLAKNLKAMEQRVDTTAAEEQLVLWEREKNSMFFNDENGYFNRKGRDAYDGAAPFALELDELQKVHAEQLTSENSRSMFIKATNSQLTKARADIMRKASSEFNAWEISTMSSRIQAALDNASLYIHDMDQMAMSLKLGRDSVMDLGLRNGDGPETVQQDIRRYNAQFAANAIDAALDKDASTAQKMLYDMKELLEKLDITDAQAKIDDLFKIEKGQEDSRAAVTIAESLVTQFAEGPNARANILEQVNLIDDPDLQKKAMRESMYQYNQFKIARNERQAAAFDAATKFTGSVESFISQNPRAWADLTKAQQVFIRKAIPVKTNFRMWNDLQQLDAAEMSKIDANDPRFTVGLSIADRRTLVADIEKAKTGGPERSLGQTVAAQTNSAIENILNKDKKDWGRDRSEQADSLYELIDAEAVFRTDAKGSRLSTAEYTDLLKDFTKNVYLNRSIWPGSTEYGIKDIDPTQINQMAEQLRREGIPVNTDTLMILAGEKFDMDAKYLPQISKELLSHNAPVNIANILELYKIGKQGREMAGGGL